MHQPCEQTLLGHLGVRLQLSQEVVGSTITPGLEMDIYIYIYIMCQRIKVKVGHHHSIM